MWKWTKSNSSSSCNVTDVTADTDSTYIPVGDAVGMYVCVVVTYDDEEGDDKTVQAVSAARVLVTRSTNVKPEFENAEGEEIIGVITREVPENTAAGQPVGAPIVAKDPEGDTLTYTLDGTDVTAFTIDRATGQLRTKDPLNKETVDDSYTVMVTATDPYFVTGRRHAGGAPTPSTVTITVTNVAEDPKVTGDASRDYDGERRDCRDWIGDLHWGG